MVWLVTHIWMFIAIAAALGLILGWALRGIRFSGGARRAMVERDIALTELGQVRGELDGLYSAQRANEAGQLSDGGQFQADFKAQAEKLEQLEAQLSASRDELVNVRADSEKKLMAATAAAAAVAGTGAAVMAGGDKAQTQTLGAEVNAGHAQVEWRNRYLESRVRSLETSLSDRDDTPEADALVVEDQSERLNELETQNDALGRQIEDLERRLDDANGKASSVTAGAVGAVAGAGAGAMIAGQAGDPVDATDIDKLTWQNEYLRKRLSFMEDNVPSVVDGKDAPRGEAIAPVLANSPAEEGSPEAGAEGGDVEQELARLRWRNRYLEGRLAYIDGGSPAEGGDGAMAADDEQKTSAAEALLERLEKSGGDDI